MEDELFDYGTFKLKKDAFIYNILNNKNIDSYIMYHRYNSDEASYFKNAVEHIVKGINDGSITKDLEYISSNNNDVKFNDTKGGLDNTNVWHRRALDYINTIANALGKDPRNKKATLIVEKKPKEVEKKEYGNFEKYFTKAINPNADDFSKLDLKPWLEVNEGNEAIALSKIFENFKENGNPDPLYSALLDSIISGLKDNTIDAKDKLAMGQMGLSPAFYNALSTLFTLPPVNKPKNPVAPLVKSQEGNQGSVQIVEPVLSGQEDTPIEEGEPVARNKKNNFAELLQNGDYYILGRNKNRKLFVYWNGKIFKVPMSFIKEDKFNELRDILKKGYRNLYESEKMEDMLLGVRNDINAHGLSSDDAHSDILLLRTDNLVKLHKKLKDLGYSNDEVYDRLRSLTTLTKRLGYLYGDEWEHIDLPNFERFLELMTKYQYIPLLHKQGGSIVKALDGLKFLYDPNNELYKTLYTEGALSEGIANADNSKRSEDLKFNTEYTQELNLNDYYKRFKLYENDADRHNDILNWMGKNYTLGDTIISLLNRYNEGIDNMYKYKQSKDASIYGGKDENGKFKVLLSEDTGNFNTLYNAYYEGANKRVFGYDPNSIKIAGTATMGRHPDITDEDIALDFNTATITNENLKNLLALYKITKSKTGHLIYSSILEPGTEVELEQLLGELLGGKQSSANTGGNDEDKLPEKEEQIKLPEEFSLLRANLPFSILNYIDTINTNRRLLNLNESRTVPLEDPIHSNRNVYGNLRVLAEANKRNAQRLNLVKGMFTSDNLHNMAGMLDAYNQNNIDWWNALALDDEMMRTTSEQSLARRYEEYLKNHEIAWNNRLRIHLLNDEILTGKSTEEASNLLSRTNLRNELKTYHIGDLQANNAEDLELAKTMLWKHINESPISYLEGWNELDLKLWDKYNSGEDIQNPVERQRIAQIQTLLLKAYMYRTNSKLYTAPPSMRDIRTPITPYKPNETVVEIAGAKRGIKLSPYMRKKGGVITDNMVKAIISYLKESNNNYNKAIDRSIKGLYNSIKLQKQKSK